MSEDRRKQNFSLLLCLISSFLILLFCTKSSPLYPLNDWEDANIIFTVGRGILDGKVPYRDLFDQKGPVAFFLYAIAALVSRKSFIGLFLLEVISFSAFLYYSDRTVSLSGCSQHALTIPVLGCLVASAMSFAHGGSVEELLLPCYAYSLYAFLLFFRSPESLTNGKFLLHGVLAGCIFWTKYTMTGFYIAWIAVLFFYRLSRKQWKTAFLSVLLFLAGMGIATVPWILYFTANNAMPDLIKYYFFNNIAGYSDTGSGNFLYMLLQIGKNTLATFFRNMRYSLLIVLGVLYYVIAPGKQASFWDRAGLLALCIFTCAGIYIGGTGYRYYGVILACFACLGFIPILKFAERKFPGFNNVQSSWIPIILLLLCTGIAAVSNDNAYLLGKSKNSLPQYQFADTIRSSSSGTEKPVVLCYKMMDSGFYMTTGSEPDIRCFTWLNSATKEIEREQKTALESGNVDFVITRNLHPDLSGYTIISEASYYYEEANPIYYLYQRTAP